MKNNLVAKSNDLIVASYELTRNEQRLLLACISQINSQPNASEITTQDEFVVTTEQMKALYKDSSKDNVYRDLNVVANNLFEREVKIALPDNEMLRTRFVSSVLFQPEKSQITVTFAQKILPYLTQLKKNFTRYRLADTVELTSIYAIRLYEMVVCWQGQNRWSETVDLGEFRYMMGCVGKYKQFGQLRESVIEKAVEQINENTAYNVSVKYRKIKHTYKSVTFSFYKKGAISLTDDKGALSLDKIRRIVRSAQFTADYNDHQLLSVEARDSNEAFWAKAEQLIAESPKEFSKRPFDEYLKIKAD
ncbi:replication initiation protein [Psychrobacter maritimus]|uniref:replication initiation protein n=1 Tax=Psychrobacter maritimus TaxID=256325 RepID=UPI00191B7649|nr:replication initiation protein [Psychrobacter maritimus]